jgi:UDP-N-acetylmuramate--alanine ligase
LSPVIEVVTNIDLEHLDYYRDLDHIKATFLEFIDKIPFYGAAIVCLDDAHVADILPFIKKRTITYGLTPQADIYADEITWQDGRIYFTVRDVSGIRGRIGITPPGIHNVYNALAVVCVGLELEISFEKIQAGLQGFAGVQRRMQQKGEVGGISVVDDYGHHPTEIRATLEAIKQAWPQKRLVVLFQPHRYSRTKALFKEFQTCFHKADYLIMSDIYPASEQPLPGVTGESLLEATRSHGQRYTRYIGDLDTMAEKLLPMLQEGDLVLTLGAGNIVRVGEELLLLLQTAARQGR